MRTKSDPLPLLKNCPNCDALIPAEDKNCSFCQYDYQSLILSKEEAAQPYTELVKSIDDAFFRVESFMEGRLSNYKGFDFGRAFSLLFYQTSKGENFTINNCKKISQYYLLVGQLAYDYDKTDYPNKAANEDSSFVEDMEAISYLNWHYDHEFIKFLKSDNQNDPDEKHSIMDIFSGSKEPFSSLELNEIVPSSGVNDFFEAVNDCSVTQIEQYNKAYELTKGFQRELLNLLYNDFDFFLFMKKEEKEAEFSLKDINEAIERLTSAGKPIPMTEMTDLQFFKKGMSKEEVQALPKLKFLNKEKLLYPFDFFCSYQFKGMLKEKLSNSEVVQTMLGKNENLILNSHSDIDNLKKSFEDHGLWTLPLTKEMSVSARALLLDNIRNSELPLQIALLNTIQFTEIRNHPTIKTQASLFDMIAKILGTNTRAVKGNINVLNLNSKEDKKRYTSHLHQLEAQEIIKKIK